MIAELKIHAGQNICDDTLSLCNTTKVILEQEKHMNNNNDDRNGCETVADKADSLH